MDGIHSFRNIMAENGYEYTPDQAKSIAKSVSDFRTEMDKTFIEDPEYFTKLRNLTLAKKQQLCRDFAEAGYEVTLEELNGLVDLVLSSQKDQLDNWQ